MNENTRFDDPDGYGSGKQEEISFRSIILAHLKKIANLASVEFRGGYWTERHVSNGTPPITIYNPDTRATYSNAVDALADLLLPYFDEEMQKAQNELDGKEDEFFKECGCPIWEGDGQTNPNLYQFRSAQQKNKRKLLKALSCFLHRKKYLEVGEIEN